MQVQVKPEKGGKEAIFNFTPGENQAEMNKLWGQDVVHSLARSALIVAVQGFVRNGLKPAGKENKIKLKSPKDIQTAVDNWKPGLKVRGRSPQEKLKEQFEKMSPEERKRLLKELAS